MQLTELLNTFDTEWLTPEVVTFIASDTVCVSERTTSCRLSCLRAAQKGTWESWWIAG